MTGLEIVGFVFVLFFTIAGIYGSFAQIFKAAAIFEKALVRLGYFGCMYLSVGAFLIYMLYTNVLTFFLPVLVFAFVLFNGRRLKKKQQIFVDKLNFYKQCTEEKIYSVENEEHIEQATQIAKNYNLEFKDIRELYSEAGDLYKKTRALTESDDD